jgi:hypothetical protein
MPVNQNRPFERHMVSNIPNLLAAGQPLSALAVGQIGFFDAKTNLSVTAPTYQTNRAIYIAQGTPDRSGFPEGAGVPNLYRKSHVIKGKSLISLRGAAASRGRGEIVTLGFDGSDPTKNLTAKPGDTFYYWIRLTGEPIYNLNPDRNKGVIIQGAVSMPCLSDCADNCQVIDCNTIADLIIADLTPQPNDQNPNAPLQYTGGKFLPGGQRLTDYVKISKVSTCDQPTIFQSFAQATISVPDNGTQSDLGLIQAQYPGLSVTRLYRVGILSTYGVLVPAGGAAPVPYVQTGPTVITNCGTCPVGSTFLVSTDQFQTSATNNGPTDYSAEIAASLASFSDVTAKLLQIDPLTGTATYQINILAGTASVSAINAALTGGPLTISTVFVGTVPSGCLLPSNTFSWTVSTCDSVATYLGTFTLTLKDITCGPCDSASAGDTSNEGDETYYTQIYNQYVATGLASSLTVSAAGVNCTRQYTLTVISNPGEIGCTQEAVVFPIVPAFNEQDWQFIGVVGVSPTGCACGIQFESSFIPRLENECTFGYFTRQYDWVHIEVSSHNPDWRSTDLCEKDPIATRIQNGAYPNGDGSAVVRIEKADRMYDFDYWYLAPNLREGFDFYFEARFDQYYDMVAIEYEFDYSSNQFFGQTDHDRYIQFIWLPEGTTGQLTTALNTYAASAGVNIDPVVI